MRILFNHGFAYSNDLCLMHFPRFLQKVEVGSLETVLFVPEPQAVQQAFRSGVLTSPYWSQVWPSARALAGFIQKHPQYVQHKTVIEIGAGLGLPSLIAARWADRVYCTDIVPEAVALAQQSARHHGFQHMQTGVLDWTDATENLKADVLLLSDVNYDTALFASLNRLITQFLNQGSTILLSTPQRLMAKPFVLSLHRFCTLQETLVVTHQKEDVAVSVLVLQQTPVNASAL